MINFICGFGLGIALSILYFVALNLFNEYPGFSMILDIKDAISKIHSKLAALEKHFTQK